MCKTLLPLKLLVDVEAWQNLEQNVTNILHFLPLPPVQKTFPHHCVFDLFFMSKYVVFVTLLNFSQFCIFASSRLAVRFRSTKFVEHNIFNTRVDQVPCNFLSRIE